MINHSKTFLDKNDSVAVLASITKRYLTANSKKQLFEESLAETLNIKHVRVTNSGTMAFYKILLTLGVFENDEILLPNYICHDLLGPIKALKAKVVPYDNAPNSWLSSIDEIIRKITPNTKVIVVNHAFGYVFKDIKQLKKLIPQNIQIVEDCCHSIALGRSIGTELIGEHSLCAFYSFNATKYIATGEGGAISSKNKVFISNLDKIKIGDNLSDINCCLGLSQLKKLDKFIQIRKEIASEYYSHFEQFVPKHMDVKSCLFFRFPILVNDSALFLKNKKVLYRKGVDSLLTDYIGGPSLSNSEKIISKTVSLPIYPSLKKSEIKTVINLTKQILDKCE